MALITLIISKCSTTGPDAAATREASVQRPSKRPRHEDSEYLLERGDSIVHIPMNVRFSLKADFQFSQKVC